jgi:hypothetical protein
MVRATEEEIIVRPVYEKKHFPRFRITARGDDIECSAGRIQKRDKIVFFFESLLLLFRRFFGCHTASLGRALFNGWWM